MRYKDVDISNSQSPQSGRNNYLVHAATGGIAPQTVVNINIKSKQLKVQSMEFAIHTQEAIFIEEPISIDGLEVVHIDFDDEQMSIGSRWHALNSWPTHLSKDIACDRPI